MAATNQNESFAILWNICSSSSVLFCDLFLILIKFPSCDQRLAAGTIVYTRETSERSPCLRQPTNSSRAHSRSREEGRLFPLAHIASRSRVPHVSLLHVAILLFSFFVVYPSLRVWLIQGRLPLHTRLLSPSKKSFGVRQPSCRFSQQLARLNCRVPHVSLSYVGILTFP